MISGIYKLTFPSGKFYIGKSADVDARWAQHRNNLAKGVSSVKMQQEYDTYKDYAEEILLHCHKNHIEIMETYYISTSDRSKLLNTTFNSPASNQEYNIILQNLPLLKHSTAELTQTIVTQFNRINTLVSEISNRSGLNISLVKNLQAEIEELEAENDDLLKRISR